MTSKHCKTWYLRSMTAPRVIHSIQGMQKYHWTWYIWHQAENYYIGFSSWPFRTDNAICWALKDNNLHHSWPRLLGTTSFKISQRCRTLWGIWQNWSLGSWFLSRNRSLRQTHNRWTNQKSLYDFRAKRYSDTQAD